MSFWVRVKSLSLKTKFVLPISGILIAGILVIGSYLIDRQSESYRRELETNGETMIRIMAMQAESGVLFELKYELDELLGKFAVFDDIQAAIIYNNDGEVLASIGDWPTEGLTYMRGIPHNDASAFDCQDAYVENSVGQEFIELNHPVVTKVEKLDRENLGITSGIGENLTKTMVTETIGRIKLVLSLESVNKAITAAQTATILLTVVVTILTIIFVAFFVQIVTKPVKQLVEITDQVSRGDLTQRVEVTQHDEIGRLANTFNKMIESLKLSRDEIEEYNRNLEEKIIQRTLELEQAQAQLVQSEKMSAIGQLAAGVAHELNNPLGGILGYAQFALEKMKKSLPSAANQKEMTSYVKYLTDIETQARRCKAIVQNLLRFSRASKETDFEPVNINSVITDTVIFVEHQLHMNQIELVDDLDPNIPPIMGNAGQLQQVFTNLIINAMHASPPESTITVSSRFSPALGEFGGAVEASVRDNGCGISPENINKIFEPFFTTKDVGKGTGLGLSVSYGIINEHGGEIRVDSKPGQYTIFTIILPLQKPQKASDTEDKEFTGKLENRL
ncbi:MAG TPA: ATP-binding protein [candidate division Zixibacteria bacterium]|nr:ATP-binding protein [candidate division Zixibacteria bacterium]